MRLMFSMFSDMLGVYVASEKTEISNVQMNLF